MESEWWVYSTAVVERVILVENRLTGERGYVSNPTRWEWGEAFHAPSHPYPWPDVDRITIDFTTQRPENKWVQ